MTSHTSGPGAASGSPSVLTPATSGATTPALGETAALLDVEHGGRQYNGASGAEPGVSSESPSYGWSGCRGTLYVVEIQRDHSYSHVHELIMACREEENRGQIEAQETGEILHPFVRLDTQLYALLVCHDDMMPLSPR